DVVPVDGVTQQVGGNVLAAKLGRERVALVDDAADGHVAALETLVRRVVEMAEGERIAEGAMLVELLPVVAALHAMEEDVAAEVGAVEQVAVCVEIEAPGVAAAVGEQFELMRDRVIAPDALLEGDAVDLGGDRASL